MIVLLGQAALWREPGAASLGPEAVRWLAVPMRQEPGP